jgi:hypothetical protein
MFWATSRITWVNNPATSLDGTPRPPIPKIARNKGTYDTGRNKQKQLRKFVRSVRGF